MEIHEIYGAHGVFSVSYDKVDAEPAVDLGVQISIVEVQYNHAHGMKRETWLNDMLLDIDNLKGTDEYIFDWLERVILEKLNQL